MKKLGIDARLYYQTGVGTYIRNLLFFLQKKQFSHFKPLLFVMQEELEAIKNEISEFELIPVQSRWHSLQEQSFYLMDLLKANVDLMHFTYFSYPIAYTKRSIATVHDLTPLLFKTGKASTKSSVIYQTKYTAYKWLLENQVRRSEKIITPTSTVKDQIVTVFGGKYADKIVPIYEGMDEALLSIQPDENIIKTNNLQNYFLYVGNFYPHKNVEKLVSAFALLPEDCKLVLAGPDDFFAGRIKARIRELKLSDRVIMIHNTNKAQLKALFTHARAMVHASLSEGFGLPLIESISLHTPVIASDIPVFKELLGKNYSSFNPESAEDIANIITGFIRNKPKVDFAGIVSKFSFETMANKHYEVYSELLS